MSMTETTENEAKTETTTALVPTMQEREFALSQRQATALANSDLVPKDFRGNVANCLIALNLAQRVGCDPLMAMQNIDVIHGRPSWRATFLIAAVNKCGRFTPLQYRVEGEGDDQTCTAFATDKETGDVVEGPPVSIGMAKAEGWYNKPSKRTGEETSKWPTMPGLMLRYRAAAFFARTVAPEVAMGLYTADEVRDMEPIAPDRSANARSAADALAAAKDITPEKGDGGPSAGVPRSGPEAGDTDGTGPLPPVEPDDVDAAFGLDGSAA